MAVFFHISSLKFYRSKNNLYQQEKFYFCEKDLAKRWNLSIKTLQSWRFLKTGPTYVKIGGRIRYSNHDILQYELSRTHFGKKN